MRVTTNQILLLIMSLLLLVACAPKKSSDLLLKEISTLEQQIEQQQTPVPDKGVSDQLIATYEEFASLYPTDSVAPECLFKAADYAIYLHQYDRAIDYYTMIYNNYPDFNKREEALFMKAYVFDNNIQDYKMASETYREFISKYPTNSFAQSARISLKYLGKSPEEVMELILQDQPE